MLLRDLYYFLKPAIPRWLQIEMRRRWVLMKRAGYKDVWPIDESAGNPPANWPGWPEGKKFALVLTHDVETQKGIPRVKKMMALETRLGFKSGFKFVADDYRTPPELFQEIRDRGFEIGLHGLTHTGNVFRTEAEFRKSAVRINQVLKEWGAEGFRAPSMYHNLETTHLLDICYDSSTFDTDPFEPQPDAVKSIFPLWIDGHDPRRGFVEMPYTLPQDFTLFVLMRESIDIWIKKLRWIAEKGGMALVITHPDYMNFGEHEIRTDEYPMQFYERFLKHVATEYKGQYWHALPRDAARYVKQHMAAQALKSAAS